MRDIGGMGIGIWEIREPRIAERQEKEQKSGHCSRGVGGLGLPLALHLGSLLGHALRLTQHRVDTSDHVERHLGHGVVGTHHDLPERLHGVLHVHVVTRHTREHLGHGERLRHVLAHLPRAVHGHLVLLAQLVDTQHGDDVLQLLVLGEHLTHVLRDVVVVHLDHVGVHDTGTALKRVHRRVDARLRHGTVQHARSVQVREGRRRRGVSDIVSRHVDSLHRGDTALHGTRDTLLKHTQVLSQRRLVTDSSRDTTQQSGHLGVRLRETEDVVDEQQHVLSRHVTEVLSHRQSTLRHTSAGTRGLVHLTVHQHALRLTAEVNHTRPHHLQVQVSTLAGALTNTGKHGHTTVSTRDVVDQLHDNHGLADTGTTEKSDLTTLAERLDQVDHLDTRAQNLVLVGLVLQGRRATVDRPELVVRDRTTLVDRLTEHVEDTAQRRLPHRDTDLRAGVHRLLAQLQQVSRLHSNRTGRLPVQVLHDLKLQGLVTPGDVRHVQRSQHRRHTLREVHVHHRTDDLNNVTDLLLTTRLQVLLRQARGRRREAAPRRVLHSTPHHLFLACCGRWGRVEGKYQ
eukprot:Hpha_TRINITY_DN15643_c1_g2::TRINITY_DN15643_c1_g2_i1::g.101236::m.101236/K02835/prfA, MTRF1, MRF1; peptide chain release factor 1